MDFSLQAYEFATPGGDKGENKPTNAELQAQQYVDKCIKKAKEGKHKQAWDKCLEDGSRWNRNWTTWLSSADDICEEQARKNCDLNDAHYGRVRPRLPFDEAEAHKKRQTEQGYLLKNLPTLSKSIEAASKHKEINGEKWDRFGNLILVSNVKGSLVNAMNVSRRLSPLMNITPVELSSLVPSVRIFKLHLKGGSDIYDGNDVDWKAGDMNEFRFQDHIRPNDALAGRSAMGAGVGLKSFEWHSTGTNSFEAPRTLMAKLKLHFKTFSDMMESSAGPGMRWSDLLLQRPGNLNVNDTECQDPRIPINQGNTHDENIKQSKTQTTPPTINDYSLLVRVGYRYPKSNILGLGNEQRAKDLKDALDRSEVMLQLYRVQHKFSFRENGTIDLEIEYIARYEGMANTYASDVFNLSAEGQNVIAQKIQKAGAAAKAIQDDINSATGVNCKIKNAINERTKSKEQKKKDKAMKEIKKLKEQIEKQKRSLRVSNYGRFIQSLLQKGRLHSVDISSTQWANGTLPRNGAKADAVGASSADLFMQVSDLINPQTQSASPGQMANAISKKFYNKKALKRGYKRINFFYLGDLINFISKSLPGKGTGDKDSQKNTAEEFEIVLGDFEYLDLQKFKQEIVNTNFDKEVDRLDIIKKTKGVTNLAFLPISLDFYSIWFTKNVINGNTVWTFRNYLNSILGELVMGSLTARDSDELGSAGKRLFNERNRLTHAILIGKNPYLFSGFYYSQSTNWAMGPSEPNPATGEAMVWVDRRGPFPFGLTQYLVISASRLPYESTKVDEALNREQGIYHLKIGADAGIVKTVDFQRTDSGPIRDWNIMKAYNTGDTGWGAVKEPYNATVKLFGSGFWQPGQYVYLNPALIGFGSHNARMALARQLGLGGFYLITKVSTVAEMGKLETTLNCFFEYYGNLPDPTNAETPDEPRPDASTAPANQEGSISDPLSSEEVAEVARDQAQAGDSTTQADANDGLPSNVTEASPPEVELDPTLANALAGQAMTQNNTQTAGAGETTSALQGAQPGQEVFDGQTGVATQEGPGGLSAPINQSLGGLNGTPPAPTTAITTTESVVIGGIVVVLNGVPTTLTQAEWDRANRTNQLVISMGNPASHDMSQNPIDNNAPSHRYP
jgi:hypothetical protein